MRSMFFLSLLEAMATMTTVSSYTGTRLIVHLPESLRQVSPTGFTHQEATFGKRLHGVSVIQPLYYADFDFCKDPTTPEALQDIKFYPTSPLVANNGPFFVLVNRNRDCNFVRKVRNAQHLGAAGVIFADNQCICADQICVNETKEDGMPCQRRQPIMPNDGSGGHDITIPSFLLWKHDAILFKKTIMEGNQTIRLEMQFPPAVEHLKVGENPSTITLDLWTSPTDALSQDIITRFQPAALAFQEHLNFTLHTSIVDGVKSGCQSDNLPGLPSDANCYGLCSNQGRYCAVVPDSEFFTNQGDGVTVSGVDVVEESLRQLCISSQPNRSLWWTYARTFGETCLRTHRFNDEKCVEQVYQQVGIEGQAIDDCMTDSGGLETRERNNILETELETQREQSIHIIPTLYVNGAPFDSTLTADVLFHVVCNYFKYSPLHKDSVERRLCFRCGSLECTDFSGCVANDGICPDLYSREAAARIANHEEETDGVSVGTFVSSIVLLVALTVAAVVALHRRSRLQLRQQVRSIVSDYVLLENNEEEETETGESNEPVTQSQPQISEQ